MRLCYVPYFIDVVLVGAYPEAIHACDMEEFNDHVSSPDETLCDIQRG